MSNVLKKIIWNATALLISLILLLSMYFLFAWVELRHVEQRTGDACDLAVVGMDMEAYLAALATHGHTFRRFDQCDSIKSGLSCSPGENGWHITTEETARLSASRYVCITDFSPEERLRSRKLKFVD
jgi:hypothetical protein